MTDDLTLVRRVQGYTEVRLLDTGGRLLASTADAPGPPTRMETEAIATSVSSGEPVLTDLYRHPEGLASFDAVAPVPGPAGEALAAVVLRSSADEYLYPLIQSWPTPSRTAETLLVRREEGDVLFLNELRHVSGAALVRRGSMEAADLPATQALLGRQGAFEGKDYRGIDVLADLRPVPGSTWFMVAKVDTAEILVEARYRAGVIGGFVVLSILLAATASASLLQRRRQAERRKSEAELRALAERQDALLAAIPDIVMETNEQRVYTWANRAGLRAPPRCHPPRSEGGVVGRRPLPQTTSLNLVSPHPGRGIPPPRRPAVRARGGALRPHQSGVQEFKLLSTAVLCVAQEPEGEPGVLSGGNRSAAAGEGQSERRCEREAEDSQAGPPPHSNTTPSALSGLSASMV